MSTKSTLTHGENFHLYLDHEDAHTGVWLEITQPHDTRTAGYAGIIAHTTVRIPLAIWEHIRHHTSADHTLADLSDAELLTKAETEARENHTRYRDAFAASKASKNKKQAFLPLLRHWGYHRSLAWQTAKNLEYLRKEQNDQRALRAATAAIAHYASPEAARERQAALPPIPGLRKLPRPKTKR